MGRVSTWCSRCVSTSGSIKLLFPENLAPARSHRDQHDYPSGEEVARLIGFASDAEPNADRVVLSACNTASADGKEEEALSGLAKGFFYAGSRRILVTHWSVDSESAVLLTTATLTHSAANPSARKAESLRRAMLMVMVMAAKLYEHLAFWVPYALVGNGGR